MTRQSHKRREELAGLIHGLWAEWVRDFFSALEQGANDQLILDPAAFTRWDRLARTRYEDLSEEQKDENRREADDIIWFLWKRGIKF